MKKKQLKFPHSKIKKKQLKFPHSKIRKKTIAIYQTFKLSSSKR